MGLCRPFAGHWSFALSVIVLSCWLGCGTLVSASEIRLKNGTTLNGHLHILNTLADKAVGIADTKHVNETTALVHSIVRIDTGWQRFYFPLLQLAVADGELETDLDTPSPVKFAPQSPVRPGSHLIVSSFGSVSSIDAFSEFGLRRVTIESQKKPLNVFQAITEVTPEHVQVDSTNCHWSLGLALKSIPIEILHAILTKQVDQSDLLSRMALSRFYAQADYFPQAFVELAIIKRDFPARTDLIEAFQQELINDFGRQVLQKLERRKQTGQHQQAESFAKEVLLQPLGEAVQQTVRKILQEYDQRRESLERVKLSLTECQSKLRDDDLENRVQPLRMAVFEELDFETLPRLDAFLHSETDGPNKPDERLGLAYSGWILGSTKATPDLDQALRLWDARRLVLEYIASDDPGVDLELIKQLRSIENLDPTTVLNLIGPLHPFRDASSIEPGTAHVVDASTSENVKYSVVLPVEYSPHRNYPLVVALRSRNRSEAQTLTIWAGDRDVPDLGCQRGFIVIAPHSEEEGVAEYRFDAAAHNCILQCVADARNRFAVDSDRIFLVGHGMGADAAVDIGMAHPDEFAGVLLLGGSAVKHYSHCWENSSHTAWYAVGKGYDSNGARDETGDAVLDKLLWQGLKCDFTLVEYQGRDGEDLTDDIPRLFDWMEKHVRSPQPKNFKIRSLRKTDNRFFWVTAAGLPRNCPVASSARSARKVMPMEIDVHVTESNTIHLKSPTENYTLRLTSDLVDFDRRLIVKIGDHVEFHGFVKPDIKVVLEELRIHGDRKRLPLAVLSP